MCPLDLQNGVGDARDRRDIEIRRHLSRFRHLNRLAISAVQDPVVRARSLKEELLVCFKPEVRGDRHILLCASDTGGYNALARLIDALILDERVAAVSLNISGAALSFFEKSQHRQRFQRLDQILDDVGRGLPLAAKKGLLWDTRYNRGAPPSTIVATGATYAGLENMWMFSAKGIFGATRLIYVADTWVPFSPLSHMEDMPDRIDPSRDTDRIDAILCNDRLAGDIIEKSIRQWNEQPRVCVTGTGVLSTMSHEERDTMRAATRQQFGIHEGIRVVALLGSYDRDGDEVFRQVVGAVEMIESLKIDDLTILVRPHPADPSAWKLADFVRYRRGSKLRVVLAGRDVIDMNSMRAVADFVVSLDSTETVVAAAMGVPAAFLRVEERGANQRYAPYSQTIEASQGGICHLSNPSSWQKFLRRQLKPIGDFPGAAEIGRRMLDVVIGPAQSHVSRGPRTFQSAPPRLPQFY